MADGDAGGDDGGDATGWASPIPDHLLHPPPASLASATFCPDTLAFEALCDALLLRKHAQAAAAGGGGLVVLLADRPAADRPAALTPRGSSVTSIARGGGGVGATPPPSPCGRADDGEARARSGSTLEQAWADEAARLALSFRHNVACAECGGVNSMCYETNSASPWRASITSNRHCFSCAALLDDHRWESRAAAWAFQLLCPAPFVRVTPANGGAETRFALADVTDVRVEAGALARLFRTRRVVVTVRGAAPGAAPVVHRLPIAAVRHKAAYLASVVKFAGALKAHLAQRAAADAADAAAAVAADNNNNNAAARARSSSTRSSASSRANNHGTGPAGRSASFRGISRGVLTHSPASASSLQSIGTASPGGGGEDGDGDRLSDYDEGDADADGPAQPPSRRPSDAMAALAARVARDRAGVARGPGENPYTVDGRLPPAQLPLPSAKRKAPGAPVSPPVAPPPSKPAAKRAPRLPTAVIPAHPFMLST